VVIAVFGWEAQHGEGVGRQLWGVHRGGPCYLDRDGDSMKDSRIGSAVRAGRTTALLRLPTRTPETHSFSTKYMLSSMLSFVTPELSSRSGSTFEGSVGLSITHALSDGGTEGGQSRILPTQLPMMDSPAGFCPFDIGANMIDRRYHIHKRGPYLDRSRRGSL